MKFRFIRSMIACVLVLVLIAAALPVALAQEAIKPLQIGILSDPHYFSEAQAGGYNEAFLAANETRLNSLWMESVGMLESALAAFEARAKATGMKYLLILGDLTWNGELEGHKVLAARLERFEEETGVQVAVVPGNHDINNKDGLDFSGGKKKPAKPASLARFREIYQNLGYDLPNMEQFTPPKGNLGGGLSYAADLEGGYRLIALDSCKYSKDGGDAADTSGMLSDDLLHWAAAQCEAAVEAGKAPIGMLHHSLIHHFGLQTVAPRFLIDNARRVCEALANAGMHFVFSGHIHTSEIADYTADSGAVIYDIATSSLADFPPTIREAGFTANSPQDITARIKTHPVDLVKPVVVNGKRYERPVGPKMFDVMYHGQGINSFARTIIQYLADDTLGAVRGAGGLQKYLRRQGVDLNGMINKALGGGVKVRGVTVITPQHVMNLLGGLMRQIDRNYVNHPGRVVEIADEAAQKILALEVSKVRSSRFLKSHGVGGGNTLADLANEGIIYAFARETGAKSNAFVQDALRGIEQGDTLRRMLDILLETLLRDLLQDEFLATLRLELAPAFRTPMMRYTLGALLDGLLRLIFNGDPNFAAVIDLGFKIVERFDLAPYDSLESVVDGVLAEYWTKRQDDNLSDVLGSLLRTLFYDMNDIPDLAATLRSNHRKAPATQENMRLPGMVTQSIQGDPAATRTVRWFTVNSVDTTDFILKDSKGNPAGGDIVIEKITEQVEYAYPALDLGVAGFPIETAPLARHTVRISGLRPGSRYTYQAGDAARGWLIPGEIKTAAGGSTTFLSFADQKAQSEKEYNAAFGKRMGAAMGKRPGVDFIVSAGDQVDKGGNMSQWKWLLNSAGQTLRSVPFLPAAGDREASGGVLGEYFALKAPKQAQASGLYYSFDYNNLHVMVLNTNNWNRRQLDWLKNDAGQSDAQWKVAVLHKANQSLAKLLRQLGVDLVIQGHSETYTRTDPPEGTVHITLTAPMFAAYRVEGGTLTCDAYRLENGALKNVDQFRVKK